MKLRSIVVALLYHLDRAVFGQFFTAVLAARTIRGQIADSSDARIVEEFRSKEIAESISQATLDRLEEQELERLRSIEDKAKATTVGIALSLSLLAGATTLLLETSVQNWPLPVQVTFLAATAYWLLGGAMALKALEVGMVYRLGPEDYVELEPQDLRKRRLHNLTQNGRATLLRSNAVSVSFRCLANGVLALAIGLVLSWMTIE